MILLLHVYWFSVFVNNKYPKKKKLIIYSSNYEQLQTIMQIKPKSSSIQDYFKTSGVVTL
jgi:hypothetical protein